MKKILAMIMTLVLCFSLLSGCSAPQSSAPAATAPAGQTNTPATDAPKQSDAPAAQTVKIAISSYNADWATGVIQEYMDANPNVTVELIEVSGNDMNTKLTMMMQSEETAPDLIAEDGFMVKSDAAAGYLHPLDEYLASWEDFANFAPSVLENGRGADGKQYALPYSTDVQGIWYNAVLMAQAGIPVPFEPKNWDELLDAARKLKAIGGEDFIPLALFNSKAQGEAASMRTFQNLYFGTGAQLFDFDQQKWIVDHANMLKVLEFVNTVYSEGLGGSLGVVSASNLSDLLRSDYMRNGRFGMFISADGTIGEYGPQGKYAWAEALDHLGFAKIPTADGSAPGFTTISGGWTWAIPAKASNKDGGMELLKFITNKENHTKFCQRYNVLAVRSDVMEAPEYLARDMSVVKDATAMLEFTHFRPSVDGYSGVTSLYTDMVESVATGSSTPQEAIDIFQSELVRMVGEASVIVK